MKARPLLHFALVGFVLFCGRSLFVRTDSSEAAHHDLLYRAALALNFDGQSAVIRERLLAVGDFLELGKTARMSESGALGIEATDPIVRRHMEELADLALHDGGATVLPSEADVEAYYAAHRDRFLDPARISFVHIYFSTERRGADAVSDAQALLRQLQADGVDVQAADRWGDSFAGGSSFRFASLADLRRVFGDEFSESIAKLSENTWSGPLSSPYGAHLIWIDRRSAEHLRPLASVRNQIVHLLTDARREELAAKRLALLR